MPTQKELTKRDTYEQDLKLSELQYITLRDNCRLFYNNVNDSLAKYEKWLELHKDIKPQVNLDYYRSIK